MSRTETKRTTLIVLAIWMLFAVFAAAALAQQHVAVGTFPGTREHIEGNRSQVIAPSANAASSTNSRTFNVSVLPPLNSIGAKTGIAVFMQRGVPTDLQLAALRRAWSADPVIRDFKGLAENDWDFEADGSIRGFGDLDPDYDVQLMIATLFSQPPRVMAQTPTRSDSIYDSVFLFVVNWLQRPLQALAQG